MGNIRNLKKSKLVRGENVKLPSKYGTFKIIPFLDEATGLEHIAILKGCNFPDSSVLTRIHSACATGDLFGSERCDCGEQLEEALRMIEAEGRGVLVYLQQEGRGIGLMNKIRAYKLQDEGMDTVDANVCLGFAPDERNYAIGAEILNSLGVNEVRLMTNNPEKILGLESGGIQISERVPLIAPKNQHNEKYLSTKQIRMGHLLEEVKENAN